MRVIYTSLVHDVVSPSIPEICKLLGSLSIERKNVVYPALIGLFLSIDGCDLILQIAYRRSPGLGDHSKAANGDRLKSGQQNN